MSPIDLGIAAVYVVGVLVLGFVVSFRIKSFRDYFVAGNRMTAAVLICTIVSTYYGLDVLFGGSEVGYVDGIVGWFYYARPYYLAIIVTALFVARRLRHFDFLSVPDVVDAWYGPATRAVVAAASFFYSLPLLALMGIGVLLDTLLGIPFAWGVIFGTAVSLAYTLMGGLLADAVTDTVQFTLMCVTLGVAAFLVLGDLGGVEGLRTALPASFFDPRGTYPLGVLVVFGLASLSVLIEPALYQRIFAARSYRSVLVALGVGVVLWAAYDWIVTLLGMAAAAAGLDTEPRYALLTLTVDVLPVGLEGLFVAGVIATAMSTIDSYLLIAGGNLSYDLYRRLIRPDLSDAELLRLTRWAIAIAALVSTILALGFTSMVSAWVFMSTVLISAALVPVIAGIYLPFQPRAAAGLCSSLAGLATAVTYYAVVSVRGVVDPEWGTRIWTVRLGGVDVGLWQEYAVLFALPASLVAFAVGHAMGRRPGRQLLEEEDQGPPVGPAETRASLRG